MNSQQGLASIFDLLTTEPTKRHRNYAKCFPIIGEREMQLSLLHKLFVPVFSRPRNQRNDAQRNYAMSYIVRRIILSLNSRNDDTQRETNYARHAFVSRPAFTLLVAPVIFGQVSFIPL